MSAKPYVSIIVPLFNEQESVGPLVDAVRTALRDAPPWELVLIDDGSTDETAALAGGIADSDGRVRLIRLARNYGQTQAMQAGFDASRGEVVVSMDGDLQNDPGDILRLVEVLHQGYDLVAGFRVRRQDRLLSRKLPSWVANRLIRWVTGVPIRDNGCSLKAYRRQTLDRMHLYSDMHRFLPALSAATAGARITEVAVRHHARRFGQSKYGLSRVLKIMADLLTIATITWFRERPLALFGIGALGAIGIGAVFALGSVVAASAPSEVVADAFVLPTAALLWIVLGCHLLLLGLVGQVFLHRVRREAVELPPIAVERHL